MDHGHSIGQHKFRPCPVGQGELQNYFKTEILCPLSHNIILVGHKVKFNLRVSYGDPAVWKLLDRVWGVGRCITEDTCINKASKCIQGSSSNCCGNEKMGGVLTQQML